MPDAKMACPACRKKLDPPSSLPIGAAITCTRCGLSFLNPGTHAQRQAPRTMVLRRPAALTMEDDDAKVQLFDEAPIRRPPPPTAAGPSRVSQLTTWAMALALVVTVVGVILTGMALWLITPNEAARPNRPGIVAPRPAR